MLEWTRDFETELLRKISEGDTDSIALLYDRYSSPLFSLAYRMLESRSDAEEVVQDVFATVCSHARTYDSNRSKLFTWMTAITRNRCIDRLRARNSRIAAGEIFLLGLDEIGNIQQGESVANENVADEAMRKEDGKSMREALDKLPREQREALELAFLSGWTHSEIAKNEDISLGTVKARIRYGLEKLRTLITKG